MGQARVPSYQSWRQVGSYFDGDGNVGLELVRYVLRLRIRFVDMWRPQVDTVSSFLIQHRIALTNVCREDSPGRSPAFRIEVGAVESVLRAARRMVPFCVKKAEDLRITIDYLEDKITGDEAIARSNEEVRTGRRSGFLREYTMPRTRNEGIRLKQLENAKKARAAYAVIVGADIQDRIREDHLRLNLGFTRLSKKYGYSQSVIRRNLRG